MKIIIDKHISFINGVLEPYAEVIYAQPSEINGELVSTADVLIIRTRTQCNATLLENSQVKFIATATIGYDHVDVAFCAQNHINWTNAAGCNAHAVLEYIDAVFRFFEKNRNVQFQGKTIGIVGVGNVGKLIVGLGKKYGMKILQCDPPRARIEGGENFVTLEEIAEKSDIVTFHTPLIKCGIDSTFHLCDSHFLSKLNPNAILINAARGGIIDENALKQFPLLVANTVLDCWENEPNINPELCVNIALSTPHIAGYSKQGKANATTMSVQSVAKFLDIKELINWEVPALPRVHPVNYDIWNDSTLLRNDIKQFEHIRSNYKLR